MAKLSTVHEAVQRAALSTRTTPAPDYQVCSGKVPVEVAERAKRILGHEGTTLNAFVGSCVALLVEDYENATRT